MSYMHLGPDPTVGSLGFGPTCRCPQCHSSTSSAPFLGEPAPAAAPALPTGVFRLDCPAQNSIVTLAVREAIRLCINAASRLEAREPSTVNHFRRIFGHDPSRPVPWAGNIASGTSVANRLRGIATGLHGRVVRFRCVCPGAGPGVNAQTDWAAERNVINLCARFWNPPATLPLPVLSFRAGVILHEMLHLQYYSFFHHAGHPSGDPERHRDNAHCYEAFVLLVDGKQPEQGDLNACANRPF